MPLTPFHLGAILLAKPVLGWRVSIGGFVLVWMHVGCAAAGATGLLWWAVRPRPSPAG